jgi:hypothetical protein
MLRERAQALEYRHELRDVRLRVKQAEVDKRVKKSEYIPDMSLALTYVSPCSFDEFVPKNFAGVGMLVIGGSDHMVAAIAEDISRF